MFVPVVESESSPAKINFIHVDSNKDESSIGAVYFDKGYIKIKKTFIWIYIKKIYIDLKYFIFYKYICKMYILADI